MLYAAIVGAFAATVLVINVAQSRYAFGWDFHAFYDAGRAYLHLRTPYVAGSLADLTSQRNFVYPLPVAAVFAPVALLPSTVAAALFVSASAILLIAALYLLGVRDPRCYLAILVGAPAFSGLEIGTISPILVFLLAAAWRFRDRTAVVACSLTVLVLAKIFLWPVAVWLLATRRYKSVGAAAAGCVVAVAAASAPLGPTVLTHYPSLVRTVSDLEGRSSLSLVAFGTAVTGSAAAGLALSIVCGGLLVLWATHLGRRGDDLRSFQCSVVAALALTPILWNHYLLLLFVPLALRRRGFSSIWLGTAWVVGAVGGSTMAGPALAVSIAVVWAVVVAQSGVLVGRLPPRLAPRPGSRDGVGRLVGALALWSALAWAVVGLLQAVPAVAALRPPRHVSEASGTASLRFLRGDDRICYRVVTEHLSLPATLEVVRLNPRRVLVRRSVRSSDATGCVSYDPRPTGGNLAKAFDERRLRLALSARSSRGDSVIAGPIVRIQDTDAQPKDRISG